MVELRESLADSERAHIRQVVQSIPAPILERLVAKWRGKAMKFTEENKWEKFETEFADLPRSWKLQLERLKRLTALESITWRPYLIENTPMFTPSMFEKPVKFSTDDLLTTDVTVQGYLHVFPLPNALYLLAMEFRSRSTKYRTTFHYLLIPNQKLLFVEQKVSSLDFFELVWNDILAVTLKELPIRPILIRQIIQKARDKKRTNDANETINLLRITLSQVISGFSGLSRIVLAGEDVLEGLSGMKIRHDLNIDFSDLGPWTEVRTNTLHLIVGEGFRVKNLDGISSVIELFAPSNTSQ